LVFAAETGQRSIHRAPWPSSADFAGIAAPKHADSFDLAIAVQATVNKAKADQAASLGRYVQALVLTLGDSQLSAFESVAGDVFAATRVQAAQVIADASVSAPSVSDFVLAPPDTPSAT
jgi:valyl-tRNA synthetase